MNSGVLIYLITPLFASVSQLFLKRAADDKEATGLRFYLNWRVIFAYGLFLCCMLLNVLAMRTLDLSLAGILEASGYLYVMALSYFVLGERISPRRLLGNALIVAGIVLALTLPF